MLQKLIQIAKKITILIIPNEEKEGWHYLVIKKLLALLRGITSAIMVTFIVYIVFIPLE